MLGLDFQKDIKPDLLLSSFLKSGLITDFFLFRDHAFRIAPPLSISINEIEITIERIVKALNNI